jgi:hypothetical protein
MNSDRNRQSRSRALLLPLGLALAVISLPPAAAAQNEKDDEALVQTLMADPTALADALKHCQRDALAEDRECHAAQIARNRQFFGNGTVPYTPRPVDPFPTNPTLTPTPRKP